MELTYTAVLLRLVLVARAIAAGAALYELRVVLPLWFPVSNGKQSVDAEAMRRCDSGKRFWVYVSIVPLTLFTVLSMKPAWQLAISGRSSAWLLATVLTLIERVMTYGYFIPTALTMMRTSGSPPSPKLVVARARWWMRLNWLRCALMVAAFVTTIEALVASSPSG